MSDDESWKTQVSYKFGPGMSGMLNMRATTESEILDRSAWLANELTTKDENPLADLATALIDGNPVPGATAAFPQGVPGDASAGAGGAGGVAGGPPPVGSAPVCAHGPMKDLLAKGYKSRWYCAAPFGTPREAQCPPRS